MSTIRKASQNRLGNCEVHANHPYYLHYRSLFSELKKAALRAHGRLLDLGCGNKPYAEVFADHVTEHVGCDIIQSSLEKVDIICPATALAVEDATYDTVLCTQVIEHVADHRMMLSETFRVLKKNGTLLLSGPLYWPLHEEPYDFFRFTKHGLRHLLENAGFVVDSICSNGGKWALAGQALIHAIESARFRRPIVVSSINRVFSWLDDRFPGRSNTMNYVVVAHKP